MDRVETPTEELLRGIAKALERELWTPGLLEREQKILAFLRDSVEDAVEQLTGTDT